MSSTKTVCEGGRQATYIQISVKRGCRNGEKSKRTPLPFLNIKSRMNFSRREESRARKLCLESFFFAVGENAFLSGVLDARKSNKNLLCDFESGPADPGNSWDHG